MSRAFRDVQTAPIHKLRCRAVGANSQPNERSGLSSMNRTGSSASTMRMIGTSLGTWLMPIPRNSTFSVHSITGARIIITRKYCRCRKGHTKVWGSQTHVRLVQDEGSIIVDVAEALRVQRSMTSG
jgi:hypothetical protein